MATSKHIRIKLDIDFSQAIKQLEKLASALKALGESVVTDPPPTQPEPPSDPPARDTTSTTAATTQIATPPPRTLDSYGRRVGFTQPQA